MGFVRGTVRYWCLRDFSLRRGVVWGSGLLLELEDGSIEIRGPDGRLDSERDVLFEEQAYFNDLLRRKKVQVCFLRIRCIVRA